MSETHDRLAALTDRTVAGIFASNPAAARQSGDHRFDGVFADTGEAAMAGRLSELDALAAGLEGIDASDLDLGERADLGMARRLAADERFRLTELRDPWHDPQWALWRGADVFGYVTRDYAPLAERATALCRHLEQLPGWLDAAAGMLDAELPSGPRAQAIEAATGYASFYRDEVRNELGDLGDIALARRLDAAIDSGAAACEAFARAVETRRGRDDDVLGEARFCAMLEAQEGVRETAASLIRQADAELARLTAATAEVADQVGGGGVDAAFAALEAEHPTAAGLLDTTAGMLDRLRDFWIASGVVTVDPEVHCRVRATPAFMSWVTAAYDSPGPLDPPGLPHNYFVTPVQPGWSDEQADQWLRHLNLACLENISVHEVYPGHFVHAVCGMRGGAALVRRAFWFPAVGEGWAHYTEQLAVEQGLADGRPLLHLAQLQDALLRACRFRCTLGIHTEGMSVEDGTRLFTEGAHIPRLAAEREAMRATHDPMYLVYTYGKLEILRWREQLAARPRFSLRDFHDRLLGCGFVSLDVARDYLLATA
ncbi:MAG TPA: DUF885 domain-containing protein [Candidatus Dormibacteraeota bacterium]|nr:DUF885 domain-containing protein [Candidatus Dormibacteraeota bacterium]